MENFTDPPFAQLCTGILSSTPSKPGVFFIPFENTFLSPINLQTGYKANQYIPKGMVVFTLIFFFILIITLMLFLIIAAISNVSVQLEALPSTEL